MAAKKYPWWRPTGSDVYVGVVLFYGDNVLLRRVEAKGYKWTFPRRKIQEEHINIEYYNACDFAESIGAQLRRVISIPGTWRGESSVAQYWRADASSFLGPAQLDASAEAQAAFGRSNDELVKVAARFLAAGLPLTQCGKPLPLSPELASFFVEMADTLPPADSHVPPGDDREWVPISVVAHKLAQSESMQGRRRDLAVWHAAQAVGRITKPLEIGGLGWTRQVVLSKGSALLALSAEAEGDSAVWPFPFPEAPPDYHMRAIECLRSANKAAWRLQACFTCRHLKCSGMATEAGGGWCTAARAPDDERRAPIPNALGWCPTYEAALLTRGGAELRRHDGRTPKEPTWSFLMEERKHGVTTPSAVGQDLFDCGSSPAPTRLRHSTFVTARLFSGQRPAFGIRLIPAEGMSGQLGPADRSYVCLGDYDEVAGKSVRDVANCLFGIDFPNWSNTGLSRRNAFPEVKDAWPSRWRAYRIRLGDDEAVDLFPGTWKAVAFIMQDAERVKKTVGLHESFMATLETHGHAFVRKSAVDFLELDEEFHWTDPGNTQRTWYHYVSRDSLLTNQIVSAMGINNRCWHGRGYIGTAPDVLARVFLMRNLEVVHPGVEDLGVFHEGDVLPHRPQ